MMKKILAAIAAVCTIAAALSACGSEEKTVPDSTEPTVAVSPTASPETTAVIETTADGGTLELDGEGNTLAIDKSGTIVSVTDKNGQPVTVTEYITTHYMITSGGEVVGTPEKVPDGGKASDSASSKADSQSAASSEAGASASSAEGQDEPQEETIPLDEYELPIIMN